MTIAYAALFIVITCAVGIAVHKALEYGFRWPRFAALAAALLIGAGAGGLAVWLVRGAAPAECIDFTADPSGRC